MSILARASAALQALLGGFAEQAARDSGVIVRRRKFTALSLARTFVLGHLYKPAASDEELARMAVQCGADVTPQAVERRHTAKLADFLEALFRRGVRLVVRADKALAPVLERFTAVVLSDSSTVELPAALGGRFPGCGGGRGGGAAAVKLQAELDLRTGALEYVGAEPGRATDGATARQWAGRPAGTLRIADLGYFNVAVFAALVRSGSHFLSRLLYGTAVGWGGGAAVDLAAWLGRRAGPLVDEPVRLGARERLPGRLLAWRVPPAVAERRRRKMRADVRRKRGGEPCAGRLALCDWTVLVTSAPPGLLSPAEAAVLYRARWQVELLFKRWKSQDRVAALTGSTPERQLVRLWARLLAALVRHWLLLAAAWGDAARSLAKACEAIRPFVGRLAAALDRAAALEAVLAELGRVVAKTCRRDKRSRPGTFELLNDPSRLEFGLN